MSNTDFQARLQRISDHATQSPDMPGADHAGKLRPQKPNYGRAGVGGAIMMFGVQVMKYANHHYESVRDTSGIAVTAAIGIAGFAVTLAGLIWIFRAVSQLTAADQNAVPNAVPVATPRRPSTGARVFFSLLGLVLGGLASLYMFLAAAARFVETDAAQRFSDGAAFIAVFLAFLSLIFWFVGLLLPGRALWRVPVYFFCGGALTYAAFRILRINVLEWPQFVAVLQ